ncbi:EF-hand domain-containing protein [Plasmodiophora brassicae]|uniref:Uncharacterized protein n=1 Tax=Plasmodiophora brassicae TaxID=37360 RepID=A0A0G4IKR3_PLABS|nr:hypothetical protein PBRA_004559 [Plasmodiophora brassicae]SPR00125.1 unnamed protein product [Plasmodiophora brassicae]
MLARRSSARRSQLATIPEDRCLPDEFADWEIGTTVRSPAGGVTIDFRCLDAVMLEAVEADDDGRIDYDPDLDFFLAASWTSILSSGPDRPDAEVGAAIATS